MTKVVHGFVMVDAWGSALNNAGLQPSERTENIVRTKVFWRERQAYPYVSGQSWRFWWRSTLADKMGWKLSPISREAKIAYTEANPIAYPDDDIFGYMRAPKGKKDAEGKKTPSETLTRLSVLKNSCLVSVGPQRPTEDFGTFSRFEGDPVPYEHEFYSTVLKGIFSLDVESAGVFKTMATAGSRNLPEDFKIPKEYAQKCKQVDRVFVLDRAIRIQRINDALSAIPHLSGGAMLARNLSRVAPSLIVLGAYSTGSHIFSHLATTKNDAAYFNTGALNQVLSDYESDRLTKVYIGREEGFMDSVNDDLSSLAKKHGGKVIVGSVASAVRGFCQEIPSLVA